MNYINKNMRRLQSRLYGNFDRDTDIIALHEQKVLFFSLPKVANTSVKRVLQNVIPETRQYQEYTRLQAKNGSLFGVNEVRDYLTQKNVLLCKHDVKRYKNYIKLAFVRNPYDRLVSCYEQKIVPFEGIENPAERGTIRSLMKAGVYRQEMSFTDFVKAIAAIPDKDANRHFRSQYSFLSDKNGKLFIDEYYYFEDLPKGFGRLRQLIGDEKLELPHIKQTQRKDFNEYYTNETYNIAYERYHKDFTLFKYPKQYA